MDLQKEREAFEAWHYEQYLLENPNIDISNAKYIYDYAHKNVLVFQLRESHFTAWQAAKAQAVPDGYKVVPVNYECVWCGCTELDEWTDETMIEAQEPTND